VGGILKPCDIFVVRIGADVSELLLDNAKVELPLSFHDNVSSG
jgi:hypothetical protein